MREPDFSLAALYAALDAQRQSRGLSWSAAVREISEPFVVNGSRPLAPSTVAGLRTKGVAEGDGVLQMLRWLGRTPESFVPGAAADAGAPLPAVGPRDVLRFDTRRLHAAVNAARVERGLTWAQIATEIDGLTVASLTNLSTGGRTGFPHVMRITQRLGVPLARFVRLTQR